MALHHGSGVSPCKRARGRSVGVRLGRGEALADILASSNQVAEGVACLLMGAPGLGAEEQVAAWLCWAASCPHATVFFA